MLKVRSALLFMVVVSSSLFAFVSAAGAVEIQQVTSNKYGIKAWLVEDHKLPIVAIHIAFLGGSEQDPVDKQGLATLAMSTLTEGAGPYDAEAFQKALADRSITINFSAGRDELEASLKCLSVDKPKAFELLHDALTKSRFDAKAVERLRGQQLSALRQQLSSPNWQARYALFSQIFAGHPYSQRHLGSTQTLQSLTTDDVRTFVLQHLALDNLIVGVAGDVSASELSSALDGLFADLPTHSQLSPISDASEPSDFTTTLVKREGTQSSLLFAMPGPKRSDSQWYAAQIANYIIGGGGFSARLMHEVRDSRGLTYGIDTELAPSDHAGLVIGEASIDNSKVAEALETIHDTMRKFYDEGVSSSEINTAKDFLTGSKPLQLTSTDKIADILVEIQRQHLGRDYLDRYSELIRRVKAREVKSAIAEWFNPDKVSTVLVGKPEGVVVTQTKELTRQ